MKVIYKQAWLNAIAASDYEELSNRPQINGVELLDNLNTEELKITWIGTQAEYDSLGTYLDTTLYIITDGVPEDHQVNYDNLYNKPTIHGVELDNTTLSNDFGIYTCNDVDNIFVSMRSVYAVAALPSPPSPNTMYYVGPISTGVYHVYLYDAMSTQIDLGLSRLEAYKEGTAIDIVGSSNRIDALYDNSTIRLDTSEGFYIRDMLAPSSSVGGLSGIVPAAPANSLAGQSPGASALADNATWKNMLDLIYPIGSVYISVDSADPGTMFGGTWERMALGRVLIGVTSSDADFNAPLKYAGSKTVTLTVNQLPSHTHCTSSSGSSAAYPNAYAVTNYADIVGGGSVMLANLRANPQYTISGDYISHVGGGEAHNNLMPYITAYIWRRTA